MHMLIREHSNILSETCDLELKTDLFPPEFETKAFSFFMIIQKDYITNK